MENATDKAKSDRLKAIAAGALALVFAGVLAMRLAPGSDSSPNGAAQTTLRATTPTVVAATASPSADRASAQREWAPEIDLERIIERNPFRRAGQPRSLQFSANSPTRGTNSVASVRESPRAKDAEPVVEPPAALAEVQAIAHGAKPAVLVDGQLVQERDIVYGQWRVVRIGKDSIVVEPVE